MELCTLPTVQEENKEKGLSSSLLYHSLYAIREKQISRNPSDITALDSRTLQNLAVYEVSAPPTLTAFFCHLLHMRMVGNQPPQDEKRLCLQVVSLLLPIPWLSTFLHGLMLLMIYTQRYKIQSSKYVHLQHGLEFSFFPLEPGES